MGMGEEDQNKACEKSRDHKLAAAPHIAYIVLVPTFLLFGFNNANTSMMPEYILHIGGNTFIAGMQNSLYVLVAVALRFGLGPLADHIGSKPLMAIGALGFLIPCALIPLFDSIEATLVLRAVQAIGLAAFHPNVSRYLANRSIAKDATRYISWSRVAATASLMIVPAILFPLVKEDNWTLFFIVMCAMAALALIVILLLPTDHEKDEPKRNSESSVSNNPLRMIYSLSKSKQGKNLLIACAIPALAALGYSAMLVFGPLYMANVLPHMNSGLILTTISIGGLLGSYLVGRFAIRIGTKMLTLVFLSLLSGGILLLALSASGAVVALGSGAILGIGYFGAITTLVAHVSTRSDPMFSGTLLSIQQSCLDLGIMLGSLIVGALLQIGISMEICLLLFGLVLAASTIAWYIVYR